MSQQDTVRSLRNLTILSPLMIEACAIVRREIVHGAKVFDHVLDFHDVQLMSFGRDQIVRRGEQYDRGRVK
jgi:hypothetical protein